MPWNTQTVTEEVTLHEVQEVSARGHVLSTGWWTQEQCVRHISESRNDFLYTGATRSYTYEREVVVYVERQPPPVDEYGFVEADLDDLIF